MNYFLQKFILFILLPLCVFTYAQNIKGIVVIDFDDAKADNIYILNKTQNLYTTTDITGHFNIQAQLNDTIVFKGSFLEERDFVVNEWALKKENLIIHINKEKIILEELLVKPKLTGFIEKDIKTVTKDNSKEKLYASLGLDINRLDIKQEEKIVPVFSSILSLDIISILKHINGYYKNLENLREYEKYFNKLDAIKDFLGVSYFTDYLNIPETDIYQFLIFVENKNNARFNTLYQAKSYLALSDLLQNEAPLYINRIKKRDNKK